MLSLKLPTTTGNYKVLNPLFSGFSEWLHNQPVTKINFFDLMKNTCSEWESIVECN